MVGALLGAVAYGLRTTSLTHREERESLSASCKDYLGHPRTEKEKAEGLCRPSTSTPSYVFRSRPPPRDCGNVALATNELLRYGSLAELGLLVGCRFFSTNRPAAALFTSNLPAPNIPSTCTGHAPGLAIERMENSALSPAIR